MTERDAGNTATSQSDRLDAALQPITWMPDPLTPRVRPDNRRGYEDTPRATVSWDVMFDIALKATVAFGVIWGFFAGLVFVFWMLLT